MSAKKSLSNRVEAAKELDLRSQELAELLTELNGEVESALSERTQYDQQLATNYEHRRGLVGRPFPNMPFKGASDLRFPLIDKYLERMKAVFFNSVIDAPHAARFIPLTDPSRFESAQSLELYFDYLMASDAGWRRTVDTLIDRALEQGKCVAKITYECSYEAVTEILTLEEVQQAITQLTMIKAQTAMQAGQQPKPLTDKELKELLALEYEYDLDDPDHQRRADSVLEQIRAKQTEIKVVRDKTVRERPVVGPIQELTDLIVPVNTSCLREAEWIAHDCYFTERELRQQAKERGGKYDNVEEIIEASAGGGGYSGHSTGKSTLEQAKQTGENLSGADYDEDEICVRELYCWLPVKHVKRMKGKVAGGDDTPVRCVLTYVPSAIGSGPLRVMELPYAHGQWPFEEYTFHASRVRFYDGRGLPQLLQPFAEEYNISRNAALNRRVLTLSPPVIVHSASKITGANFRTVGQVFQTSIPPAAAIHIPQWPDLSSGFELDAASLEQFAAEYIGMPDLRLRGYSDSPTATQVSQVQAPADAQLRRELEHFHDFLGRVYWHIFQLEKQFKFGDQKQQQNFANMGNPEESAQVTAQDFAGDYIIQSGGDLQRLDNVLATQSLYVAYQSAMQQPQLAPMLRPFDVNWTTFSKLIGPVMTRQWFRTRKEAEQYDQQFMQMQAQAAAQMESKGKNPRNKKMKQLPNSGAGMLPQ
jgi:hypothetical protein